MDAPVLFEKRAARRRFDFALIPLINVIFLLVLFFLVAGNLRAPDTDAVELPLSATGRDTGGIALTLRLAGNGALTHAGVSLGRDRLAQLLAEHRRTNPGQPVSIRAARDVPATLLTVLVRKIQAAGGAELVIATEPE